MKFKLLIWLLFFQITSMAQVRLEVVVTMPLPIPNESLFLAVDFNNWQPGDNNFKLKKQSDSLYYIDLPPNIPAYFEYKITQGNWIIVESKVNGRSRSNRVYNRGAEVNPNCTRVLIEGWENKPTYNFVLNQIPENTPKDATIYIAGNFNNWKPSDNRYKLQKQCDGTYRVPIVSDIDRIEYKFTRGDWKSVEGFTNGKTRPNRQIFRNSIDGSTTIPIEIVSWEDLSGTFNFFSIFDLLLLFSAFQCLLLIVAIRSLQDYNQQANRSLVISLAFMALVLLVRVLMSYREAAQVYTKLLFLPDFALFIYAPLFYFYLQKLLFKSPKLPARWWLHCIAAGIQLFVYLPYLFTDTKILQGKIVNRATDLELVFKTLGLLAWVFNLYYWLICRRLINSYRKLYANQASYVQNIQYLSTVLGIQAVCLVLWLFAIVLYVVGLFFEINVSEIMIQSIDTVWLVFSTIPYLLGYFAIQQPEIFKLHQEATPTASQNVIITEDTSNDKKENEVSESAYLQVYKNQIDSYMVKHKPYTNAGLTINELAISLKIQPHLLSKIINEVYNKNFFDFVNEYRIEEFKKRFEDPRNNNYTLLALAFEVGFNSKSAFNRSFKKMTQQSPREYFYESRAEE